VEGGVGTPGQGVTPEGDGGRGDTFCAPKQMDSNCAGETVPKEEAIRSEQGAYPVSRHLLTYSSDLLDWQGAAHLSIGNKLRAIARNEAGRTTQTQLDNTAVFITVLFLNDPAGHPAGCK
jgi:hypothetical protein